MLKQPTPPTGTDTHVLLDDLRAFMFIRPRTSVWHGNDTTIADEVAQRYNGQGHHSYSRPRLGRIQMALTIAIHRETSMLYIKNRDEHQEI